jgi:hypothetical protein
VAHKVQKFNCFLFSIFSFIGHIRTECYWKSRCWHLFDSPACFATSAYRQPLPNFPLAWSAKGTGRSTTDRTLMWFVQDGVPAHFICAVWGVLNNNLSLQMDRQRRAKFLASTVARFLSVGTPKMPCVCSSSWQRRCISTSNCCQAICSCPVISEWKRSSWWDVSMCAFNLMQDIVCTYSKCTRSALSQKLNLSADNSSCTSTLNSRPKCLRVSTTHCIWQMRNHGMGPTYVLANRNVISR